MTWGSGTSSSNERAVVGGDRTRDSNAFGEPAPSRQGATDPGSCPRAPAGPACDAGSRGGGDWWQGSGRADEPRGARADACRRAASDPRRARRRHPMAHREGRARPLAIGRSLGVRDLLHVPFYRPVLEEGCAPHSASWPRSCRRPRTPISPARSAPRRWIEARPATARRSMGRASPPVPGHEDSDRARRPCRPCSRRNRKGPATVKRVRPFAPGRPASLCCPLRSPEEARR